MYYVDELASHADRRLIRARKTESATILLPSNLAGDKNSNQRLINEVIETHLNSLQRKVAQLISA